ncbi:hypothetical protein PENARI_c067G00368 [Penicillium arizonense]|uniref:Uncharacterized protein n=1 Tax=Penicillium arizonense TaxID=1835702 RepID=A0A1F5L1N4_PENAI|nr:hypothetical protein PENARI_c096G00407 [Penicillium arizonense]XP_022482373.1 hypothetical protein PENARI_c091G04457 [Penicillium arizonense]XP_022482541.1 hypothetical protein PENARI_c067G00368 [Penicillium arizonense]OGE46869.1 hypothetical protein PENARI_c096G00407 [Penicillium arizonense]OGE46906.1 hypothetical protein PENARI_c091G04457 [Penicillium arizonense]OGE47075.1 hypothetical protein PENARI_c067G00368 [Penicillium arizonense]
MENPSKTPEMTDTQGEAPLYTQSTSTEEPPLPGVATPLPIKTHDIEKQTLAVEPFRPILEVLKQIEEEDTELAFRTARLVGYIRCLWESCVSKHTDIQQLEEENEKLRTGNIQLCNEGNHLKRSQDEQVARLHAIDDALDEVRGRLIGVLKVWNELSVGDLAILPEDGFPQS